MRTLLFLTTLLSACGSGTGAKKDTTQPAVPLTSGVNPTTADSGAFTVALEWLEGPRWGADQGSDSACGLIFTLPSGKAVTSVTNVALKPYMPAMGHPGKTDDLTLAPESKAANVVDARGFRFTMPGNWELDVTATVNGASGTAKVPLTVPR